MIWLVLIAAVIFLLLLFLLVLLVAPVRVEIFFTYADHRKDLFINLKVLKFIKIKRTIPVMQFNEETFSLDIIEKDQFMNTEKERNKSYNYSDLKQQWQQVQAVIDTTKDVIPHVKKALHTINLHHLHWHSLIGLKSAHHTAIATGALYSMKGTFSSILSSVLNNGTIPSYSIQPHYNKLTCQTELKCILSFQIGQIMRELFSIMRKYAKIKKGGY